MRVACVYSVATVHTVSTVRDANKSQERITHGPSNQNKNHRSHSGSLFDTVLACLSLRRTLRVGEAMRDKLQELLERASNESNFLRRSAEKRDDIGQSATAILFRNDAWTIDNATQWLSDDKNLPEVTL